VNKLSELLYNVITSARLRVFPDLELEREILGLRVVQKPDGWRVDHRAGGFSDRAVALGLAMAAIPERFSFGGEVRAIHHGELARKRREEATASPDLREGDVVKIGDDTKLRVELERRRRKEGVKGLCFYCAEWCGERSTICDKCMGSRRHALTAWRGRRAA
jgi:hypothetical protein